MTGPALAPSRLAAVTLTPVRDVDAASRSPAATSSPANAGSPVEQPRRADSSVTREPSA